MATKHMITAPVLFNIEPTSSTGTFLCHSSNGPHRPLRFYIIRMTVIVSLARHVLMPCYAMLDT
jgi:hypothetical protein